MEYWMNRPADDRISPAIARIIALGDELNQRRPDYVEWFRSHRSALTNRLKDICLLLEITVP